MNSIDHEIKISVIVPVYNTEIYLRKCLDSLVNQTFREIEIVVINDGSTDGSAAIIEEYARRYPERFLVLTQKNSGQAAARNRGVEVCHGAYIGFLDSDDYMDTSAMERMYEAITSQQVDMVYCDYFLDTGTSVSHEKVRTAVQQRTLFIDCFVDPWNKLYRADILKENGIRFPEGFFYEDTGWFIETIPYISRFAKLDMPLIYHLRRPGSSMTALDDRRVAHIFPVLEEMLSFYQKKGLFDQYRQELEYFCVKILLCSSMVRISRVSDQKLADTLVDRSFRLLHQYFPDYRGNPYLKGRKVGIYLRCLTPAAAKQFVRILKLCRRNRAEKHTERRINGHEIKSKTIT